MRLLDRYLLRELLVPFCYCLGGFLLVWISYRSFIELGDLQEKNLRFGDIAEYFAVQSPAFLVGVLPIALLLALLYALTNHARHHEITAIRAAGVSLWRLALPYFAAGFAAGGVLFTLNELWAADGAEQAQQIKNRRTSRPTEVAERNRVRNIGFTNARDGRTWQIGEYDFNTSEMLRPKVIWTLSDGSQRWLDADRAGRVNGVWTFFNAREYRNDARTNSALVPSLQTNVVARPQFTETPDEIRSEIKISKRLSKGGERNADVPLAEILDYLRFHPNPSRADRYWLYTKMHGRLAAPWTCLVVVLIALPFGASSGRRNIFVGVASSVFICFGYFILAQLGIALGTGGYLPAWLAGWFANLSFGMLGLWLTARVR
ncbi:MAG: LptF/LptG family permease [Verrucomicrobia bacterium]|jgi:lipopolysaccharide export system permease protein|nr:LptF/LptG family permease [Verrucomicrobiota bacterium]